MGTAGGGYGGSSGYDGSGGMNAGAGSGLFAGGNSSGGGGRDAAEGFATGGGANSNLPAVIGDLGPSVRTSAAPTVGGTPGGGSSPGRTAPPGDFSAIVRVFKVSENQSPRPQDRFFYSFNYFNNIDKSINQLNNSPISGIRIYRQVFGFEKTFDQGRGSIGMSLPLYSQFANHLQNSGVATPGHTALGDLNIFTKYILKQNMQTGSLVSAGLLVTPPTGTRYLAGANYFPQSKYPGSFVPVHDLQIQPFLGYTFQRDRFFIQGFSALNVAVNPQDVSLYFNDVQFGYFVFRDRESDRFLTAVIPTFEAHITDPINHRGITSPNQNKNSPFTYDPYATPDIVNLTYGLNFEIRRNSVLTFAFAEPVTANRPFAYEATVLFNYRFGRSASRPRPTPSPNAGT